MTAAVEGVKARNVGEGSFVVRTMRSRAWILGVLVMVACEAQAPDPEGVGTSSEAGDESTDDAATSGPTDPSSASSSSSSVGSSGSSTSNTSSGSSSSNASNGSSESSEGAAEVPPIGAADLRPWLESGAYLDWTAESAPLDSAGPHFGVVRTFVNSAMFDSLSAGSDPHPMDAAAVKELYGDGSEVLGWSVMIKVADGSGGDTWYWLEYYQGSTYGDGVGDASCTGCHGDGTDHVLSPFPLQ
jgi:hypothetical protein